MEEKCRSMYKCLLVFLNYTVYLNCSFCSRQTIALTLRKLAVFFIVVTFLGVDQTSETFCLKKNKFAWIQRSPKKFLSEPAPHKGK